MVNCNPETVSTDYDTADRLYFEPLTFEDVLEVFHSEDSSGKAAGGPGVVGVIVQLGGQTPLGLAKRLKAAGVPIVGTSPESIDLAEDRGAFGTVLAKAGLRSPGPRHRDQLRRGQGDRRRDRLPGAGPPVVRARRPGHGDRVRRADPAGYIAAATEISPDHPVLVDRFLTTPSRSTWTRSATPPARSTWAA
jgi:carbamoyl-phosphate synthase large subunit